MPERVRIDAVAVHPPALGPRNTLQHLHNGLQETNLRTSTSPRRQLAAWATVATVAATLPAVAPAATGKLVLTGGVSSIDGAAGGGLTPWAVIGSQATEGQVGATLHLTRLSTQRYGFTAMGAALGLYDRVELSVARQELNAGAAVPSARLKLDIVGLKVRLAGEAILDADTWMPQLAVGLQYKHLDPGSAVGGVLDSADARRSGTDLYLSATKLLLAQGVLLNGTVRATRANQNGLLGFGSSAHRSYRLMPEVSVAWLLRRDLAVGVEYRMKPDALAFAGSAFREHDWKDLFIAWVPSPHVSLTLAWVDLGNVVGQSRQRGAYASVQLAF
jgi:hypothetical protein